MVATVRCEEIANEKFSSFVANEVHCYVQMMLLPWHSIPKTSILSPQARNYLFLQFHQEWCLLQEAIQSGAVAGFGKKLTSLMGSCLSE